MALRIHIEIKDEGLVESLLISDLIQEIEFAVRRASSDALRDYVRRFEFSTILADAVAFRILISPESLFWIEDVESGSKWLKGVVASALLGTILNSTIGESLKEGWKKTEIHKEIVVEIPKIEAEIADKLKKYLDRYEHPGQPISRRYEFAAVAIRREDEDWFLMIESRPIRWKPTGGPPPRRRTRL
jgi:hypothetical protein